MNMLYIFILFCIFIIILIIYLWLNTSNNKILEKNYPEGVTRYNIDNNYKKFDPKIYKKISEKLSLPLHLMLFNISGDANIALSIRTAAVYGCSDVWIVGKKKFNKRALVGAHHYINIHKIATVDNTFFIKHKVQPFVIEQNGIPIEEVKFKHHMNNNTNYGLDLWDILIGSKYDWTHIENHNDTIINLIVITIIIVYISNYLKM